MPYTFVAVGRTWINLDLVTSVELIEDPGKPGIPTGARVYYVDGKPQDFTDPGEVKDLVDFLRKHRAT